jgi:hypothetical protein
MDRCTVEKKMGDVPISMNRKKLLGNMEGQ